MLRATDLSLVIPHRQPARELIAQLPQLLAAAGACSESWELILIDGSDDPRPAPVEVAAHPRLRWLKLERPDDGLSAALTAGLVAARGARILVVEPGEQYPTDQWRRLLAGLTRYDAVFGCRASQTRRAERGALAPLTTNLRDADCLLWALRREAAGGLRLPRGMQVHAAELLRWQGRRVAELVVDHRLPVASADWPDVQPSLLTWLAWRWLARRPAPVAAQELDLQRPAKALKEQAAGAPATIEFHEPNTSSMAEGRRPLRLFFSVGEPSGDVHGANLIRALRRRFGAVDVCGFAGPRMQQAGCRSLDDLTQSAVMWLAGALAQLPRFFRLLGEADRTLETERPDAVVLIDYPGFNWHVARKAKARGIPVIYYSPPQVWAWASWRIHKMRRLIDHVLSGLPFEADWLRAQGCHASYIGHPFFDEVREHQLDEAFVAARRAGEGPLVAVLPGSRTAEVERNFPQFLKVVRKVREHVPKARFAVAAYREAHAERTRALIAESGLPIEVFVGRTPELIAAADCCLSVSGSVSLELLHHAKPTVIAYQVGRVGYFAQSLARRVKYITLVNLLATDELHPRDLQPYDPRQPDAERVLFPEYLSWRDRTSEMAAHLIGWLRDEPQRAALVARLIALRDRFGQPGAAEAAAEYIGHVVAARRDDRPAPPFVPGQASASGYRSTAA